MLPSHFAGSSIEMSNGLAVAERRSILTSADVDQAVIDIEQLVAQAVDINSDVVPGRQALITARGFQLSAYDAVLFGSCAPGKAAASHA